MSTDGFIRFYFLNSWDDNRSQQEMKTAAQADVYKAWNPKGWQTLRKAEA